MLDDLVVSNYATHITSGLLLRRLVGLLLQDMSDSETLYLCWPILSSAGAHLIAADVELLQSCPLGQGSTQAGSPFVTNAVALQLEANQR